MMHQLVAIGAGQGGERAVRHLFAVLPSDFPATVLLSANFAEEEDETFRRRMSKLRNVRLIEARDKLPYSPGTVIRARRGYHLLADAGHVSLSLEPPVFGRRPSVDVLFRSAAFTFGPQCAAVWIHGERKDGETGMRALQAARALRIALAHDGNPAVEGGLADKALSVAGIAQLLIQLHMAQPLSARDGEPRSYV